MSKHVIRQWPDASKEWPEALRAEFAERAGIGQVGSRLVSESDRVRVWHLALQPGERIGFHTHVLDYFWTAVTGGKARSHYADGRIAEAVYEPGSTKHFRFAAGEFMIHDLENVGETELVFTTVEFMDGENAPLPISTRARAAAA